MAGQRAFAEAPAQPERLERATGPAAQIGRLDIDPRQRDMPTRMPAARLRAVGRGAPGAVSNKLRAAVASSIASGNEPRPSQMS